MGKALAAYEETLVTGRTAFDDFRDALARGEPAPASYPLAAQRGLKLFVGRGNCYACHSGPNFTDGAFRGNGRAAVRRRRRVADTVVTPALRTLRASRFNLLGPYSDDATGSRCACHARSETRRPRQAANGARRACATSP